MHTLILALLVTMAHAKDIALTFDDCPRKTDKLMTGMERAKKITGHLAKHGVKQAAFFCNSPTRTPDGIERLKHFAAAGHVIANHSATHPDFNKSSVENFIKNIDRAHRELEGFDNFRKWFRFPFLREGKTERGRDAIRAHLAKTGYKNGYVTVDNADWYMDDLLVKAVNAGKKFDESKLCSTYTSIMVDEAKFYDDMSVSVLGRSVKHVLLLHETDLNALCLGVLVSGLRAAGWNIVPADEAFNDPIALREPLSMKLNQGRVVAMALDRGFSGSIWSKWTTPRNLEQEMERRGVWE